MKASDLKPGQFFVWRHRRRLAAWKAGGGFWCATRCHSDLEWIANDDEVNAVPQCWDDHIPDAGKMVDPKLQLREGAFYRRRDEKIVGPCKAATTEPFTIGSYAKWTCGGCWYRDDGTTASDALRLIAEVPPPEPRTEQSISGAKFVVVKDGEGTGHTISDGELCEVEYQSGCCFKLVGKTDYWNINRFRRATPAEIAKATEPQPVEPTSVLFAGRGL